MNTVITRQGLETLLTSGEPFKLVEALPLKYYQEEHLPQALNLPLEQLAKLASELLPEKTELVVTYCASVSCENSATAAAQLRQLGYTNVLEYREGKADWKAAGLPLSQGHDPSSAESRNAQV